MDEYIIAKHAKNVTRMQDKSRSQSARFVIHVLLINGMHSVDFKCALMSDTLDPPYTYEYLIRHLYAVRTHLIGFLSTSSALAGISGHKPSYKSHVCTPTTAHLPHAVKMGPVRVDYLTCLGTIS